MNPIERRITPESPTIPKTALPSQSTELSSSAPVSQDTLTLSNTAPKAVQSQGVLSNIMGWLKSVFTQIGELFGRLFHTSSAQSVQPSQVSPVSQNTQSAQSAQNTQNTQNTIPQGFLPGAISQQTTSQSSPQPTPPQPVDAQSSSDSQSNLHLGLTSENDTVMGVVYVDGENTLGQVAAGVKDGKVSAKASAEKISAESTLKALAAYDNGKTSASLEYNNPTTEAEVHYTHQTDLTTMGGKLTKNYDHSALSVSGDYLKNSVGNGYRVDGTWKTDDIGEKVMGYNVHGEASVGAMKLPGQDLNTYASGRLVGEKENSSFFLGVQHQNGPMFNNPDTRVEAGFSMKF